MASGSSGRPDSSSKGFDFATDDILCSYEDYGSQDNPNHSDPTVGTNSGKDFPKSRVSRPMFPTANSYSPPEETLSQELASMVERSMKKYSDNLMRFLEGISSRLSQLELYCYNLDKSIGEMRSDLVRDHGEADSKLKSLEKHLQEVHRSVQILRDKQELAEAQKELAKLQLAQKESSSSSGGTHEKEKAAPESKKTDDVSESSPNTQLALALPSQVAPQPPAQTQLSYYLPSSQLPSLPPTQPPPYLPPDSQYRPPQLPSQAPQQGHPPQTAPNQQFSQYQQPWPPQVTQPMRPPQPSPMPPQQQPSSMPMPPQQQPTSMPMPPQNEIRAPSSQPSSVYSPYMAASQPGNPPPPETMPGSMPMHMPFPGASRVEPMQYGGYGGPGRNAAGYAAPPGSHPPISSAGMYMDPPPTQTQHYSPQGGYPPANPHPRPPQFVHNRPYNELIEKLVSMGYRGDHVVSVIQRMEESGQPVDFNSVLDRLNGYSSASPQRGGGW